MKAKKVLAMLMASAMIMGTSVTAFAAETANIFISGLNDDATVTYVQVVEPDTTSPLGWKFVDEEEVESPITNAFIENLGATDADDAIQTLIELGELESADNANASSGTISSSAELGAALKDVVVHATNTTGVSGNNTITGISSAGLYVISVTSEDPNYSYIPMLAYVKDAGLGDLQNVRVGAKGSYNVILKNLVNPDEDGSVSEGDEVEYTAAVTYPFYSVDDENKAFEITDTLTNGTFKEDTVVVYVEGPNDTQVALVEDVDYTINEYADSNKLVVTFTDLYNSAYAGKTITLTYTAIVGNGDDGIVDEIVTNLDTTGDSVTTDEVTVTVTKVDNSDTPSPLEGASFTIYEEVDPEEIDMEKLEEGDEEYLAEFEAKGYMIAQNVSCVPKDSEKAIDVTLILKVADEVRVTDDDGEVTFVGLDADKTYYVKETNAPTGYYLNENYYAVGTTTKNETASTDKVFVYNDFDGLTVVNQNLASLPSTGGIGTTIFTIGGCAIMITAAGLYFATRKKVEK